jgi:alpha-glucosidase/alpha-D-xyloside xylohydrolase
VAELNVIGARVPIPWLVGTSGWGLLFHLPFGGFDLQGEGGRFEPRDPEAPVPLDIFVVVSSDPAEIMAEYANLTGHPHMPPLWALGYQQSHRTLASREEVLAEAETFREKKLPCDVFIYLSTGFCPSGWNTGHGSFTFNERVFPDPAEIVAKLHQEHIHVVLYVVDPPEGLHGTVDQPANPAEENAAANVWAKHLAVFRLGIDGWWPDEGDKLDVESRLARNRLYWEGPQLERPNQRPYALHRNGYAGMQRYAWLWSGDVDSAWETLRAQVPVGINTGLSGEPFWGTDTGGFCDDSRTHRRALRPLVPVLFLLPSVPFAWTHLEAATALRLEHGRPPHLSSNVTRARPGFPTRESSGILTWSPSAESTSIFATACCLTFTRWCARLTTRVCPSCERSGCTILTIVGP